MCVKYSGHFVTCWKCCGTGVIQSRNPTWNQWTIQNCACWGNCCCKKTMTCPTCSGMGRIWISTPCGCWHGPKWSPAILKWTTVTSSGDTGILIPRKREKVT